MKNLFLMAMLMMVTGCSVVGPGQKGVRITQGEVGDTTLNSGWYLWIPFITKVKTISVRVQKTEATTEAASKDLQKVAAIVAINWHVDPSTVTNLYKTVGDEDDVVEQIINPAVNEVMKAATAKMTAEEILTKRIELKKNIDESLAARLKNYSVLVDDVSLVDLDFTKEFNGAVESKQIAEQQAKQAEYDSLRATQEAKSEVNRAKGEAEANLTRARAQAQSQQLLRQTLTKDVLQLEYLKKWNGQLPTVLTGSSSGVMLNLPSSTTTPATKEQE